jgi:hypothetical protein
LAASATLAIAAAPAAHETQIITFGQVGSTSTVTGTASGGVTTIVIKNALADISQIVTGGAPIDNVYVNLGATSTAPAQLLAGIFDEQSYKGSFCISSGKGCTGVDYLNGTFTDAVFGNKGGSQLTVNVSDPPDSLALSSGVIPAKWLVAPSALGFTFTDVGPSVAITGSGSKATIRSFTAAFAGDVSASAVPEPATWAMLVLGSSA